MSVHESLCHLSNDVTPLLLSHAPNKGCQAVLLTNRQTILQLKALLGSSLYGQHLQDRVNKPRTGPTPMQLCS